MDYYALRNDPLYYQFNDYISRNYRQGNPSEDYALISVSSDNLLLNVDDVKEHLKLDIEDSDNDEYYELLINAATMTAEFIIRQEIIEKKYYAYLSTLTSSIKLLKTPVKSIDAIEYLDTDNTTWLTVDPTVYYSTFSKVYPIIYLDDNKSWPTVNNTRFNNIRISFTAGMKPDVLARSSDLKLAVLNHIAVMYAQRGDWGGADMVAAEFIQNVPSLSKLVYSRYRITNRR